MNLCYQSRPTFPGASYPRFSQMLADPLSVWREPIHVPNHNRAYVKDDSLAGRIRSVMSRTEAMTTEEIQAGMMYHYNIDVPRKRIASACGNGARQGRTIKDKRPDGRPAWRLV